MLSTGVSPAIKKALRKSIRRRRKALLELARY
jgi:hypothetical protein